MTVLVAGAHAVGKTYLAKPAAQQLGMRYATASQLIREERGHATWTVTKQVTEIDENQKALVRAVSRILDQGEELLLDGHLVLRRSPLNHQPLAESVFRGLCCRKILVLSAPASVLLSRLKARGDETWTANEVETFIEAEIQHGKEIAAAMGIPASILDSPSAVEFAAAVVS